jgi:hypothetical protein
MGLRGVTASGQLKYGKEQPDRRERTPDLPTGPDKFAPQLQSETESNIVGIGVCLARTRGLWAKFAGQELLANAV